MSEINDVRRKERAATVSAAIDLDVLVEKVYQLMQADIRLTRKRRGNTRIGK